MVKNDNVSYPGQLSHSVDDYRIFCDMKHITIQSSERWKDKFITVYPNNVVVQKSTYTHFYPLVERVNRQNSKFM